MSTKKRDCANCTHMYKWKTGKYTVIDCACSNIVYSSYCPNYQDSEACTQRRLLMEVKSKSLWQQIKWLRKLVIKPVLNKEE